MVRVFLSAAIVGLAGCAGQGEAPPVASVVLKLDKERVPIGGPLDLTYRFEPTAVVDGDYRVFVHVLTSDGTLMWTDDHDPQPATSAWRPGEVVEYTRTVFVPGFPYIGDATIRVGLHRGNDRLPLHVENPDDAALDDNAYAVGSLRILPEAESVFVIFGNGWHPAEYALDNPRSSWQWTGKSASVSFRNPRQDVTLFLQYDGRPDRFGDVPQQVTLSAGTQTLDTFSAYNLDPVLRRISLKAADLGADDMVEIRISVDRTFLPVRDQPHSTDTRELGIRVYYVFVEPR